LIDNFIVEGSRKKEIENSPYCSEHSVGSNNSPSIEKVPC